MSSKYLISTLSLFLKVWIEVNSKTTVNSIRVLVNVDSASNNMFAIFNAV